MCRYPNQMLALDEREKQKVRKGRNPALWRLEVGREREDRERERKRRREGEINR